MILPPVDGYPTDPLYSCPGRLPLVRYRNTGEYGEVSYGQLRAVLLNIDPDLAQLVSQLGARAAVERYAVPITAAEYARLTAYRCHYSKVPPPIAEPSR